MSMTQTAVLFDLGLHPADSWAAKPTASRGWPVPPGAPIQTTLERPTDHGFFNSSQGLRTVMALEWLGNEFMEARA